MSRISRLVGYGVVGGATGAIVGTSVRQGLRRRRQPTVFGRVMAVGLFALIVGGILWTVIADVVHAL